VKARNRSLILMQDETPAPPSTDVFLLYGDITMEVANEVVEAIKNGVKELRVNSYGGDFFAGASIAAAVKEHDVYVVVDGLAGSAAALPVIAAKRNASVVGGYLYVHRTLVTVTGNCNVLRFQADQLERFDEEVLVTALMERSGKDRETVISWLDAKISTENGEFSVDGTVFSAEEAKELGLIDEIIGAEEEEMEEEEPTEEEAPTEATKRITKKALKPVRMFVPDNPPGGEGVGVEGDWERPNLEDFTDKGWDELEQEEKRFIAAHFAWAEDLDTFGSLKLPHHYPPTHDSHPKASLNGVRNALARLPLTEGLNDDERERVRDHLLEHLPVEERAIWLEVVNLFSK